MPKRDDRVIGYSVKTVSNLIHRKLDEVFAQVDSKEDLKGMQGPVIGFLYDVSQRGEDVFQRDIEKKFGIRRSTASIMIQGLEQKGYIIRETVPYDARLKRIILTEKSIIHDREIRKRINQFNKELEYGITLEEKEEFFRILDKIRKNLE